MTWIVWLFLGTCQVGLKNELYSLTSGTCLMVVNQGCISYMTKSLQTLAARKTWAIILRIRTWNFNFLSVFQLCYRRIGTTYQQQPCTPVLLYPAQEECCIIAGTNTIFNLFHPSKSHKYTVTRMRDEKTKSHGSTPTILAHLRFE